MDIITLRRVSAKTCKRNQSTEAMQGSPEYAANMSRAAAERRMLERVEAGTVKQYTARNPELPDGLWDDGGCKYAVGKRWCNAMRQIDSPYCSEHADVCRANWHKK